MYVCIFTKKTQNRTRCFSHTPFFQITTMDLYGMKNIITEQQTNMHSDISCVWFLKAMYSWKSPWTPKLSVLEQVCMYCTKYILKLPFNKFPRRWIKYTFRSCYDPLTFRFLSCKDIIPVAFQMLLDDTIWAALNPLLRLCFTEISSCSFWSVLGWIFVADSFTFYEF